MTFDIKKRQSSQEVVKKITIYLNACKYTQGDFITQNKLITNNPSVIGENATGATLELGLLNSPNWLSTWSSYPEFPYLYFVINDEAIKVEVVDSNSVIIRERGLFGTIKKEIIRYRGVTIAHKGELDSSCYYSQTCSTSDSYSPTAFKELVFSSAPLPAGSIYHGGLAFKDVNYESSEIKPGETIGSRAKLSVKINDQSHNDYDINYYTKRHSNSGTLFGKLLARHPYFNGRKIKYSVGLRQAGSLLEPEWQERYFIVDTVNLSGDQFSITALDPLILTEGKKAKMPIASSAQLVGDLTASSTSLTFGNAAANYFGTSGNLFVKIDSEILEVTANGTTTMPIVNRGIGTATAGHSVNATIQNCIRFIDEHVIDCITYALSTWTDTPPDYIDNYDDVKALIPTAIISDYIISSPKDVVEFINMCILIGNLVFYFDDVAQKIVIKYVAEFQISPIFLRENDHIKKGTIRRDLNFKERYTRFNLSWAPKDLSKDSDAKNQQISLTEINAQIESPQYAGEVNERKAQIIPALGLSTDDYLLGAAVANRIAASAVEMPDIIECELDAENIGETQGGDLSLGTVVSLSSSDIQSKTGVEETRLYQILKISGDPFESFKVKMKHFQLLDPTEYDFVIDAGTYINYDLSDHFTPSAGVSTIFIKSGAVFGSYDTSIPAFTTGEQAEGVTLKIIARWQVLGMGGNGQDAWRANDSAPSPATDGGTAFDARCDCIIDNGSGLIWAGGGGSGGMKQIRINLTFTSREAWFSAEGGGGGQGFGSSISGRSVAGNEFIPPDSAPLEYIDAGESGSVDGVGYYNESSIGSDAGMWGKNGAYLVDSYFYPDHYDEMNGGLAGYAIKKNGYNVTIISGNNDLSVRGRIG